VQVAFAVIDASSPAMTIEVVANFLIMVSLYNVCFES